ncbi:9795_t:CDS:1, partial [Acaulospora morrowiae]
MNPKSNLPRSLPPDTISQNEYQDCLSCKLVGSATFVGLGSYSFCLAKKSSNFGKVGFGMLGLCEYLPDSLFNLSGETYEISKIP